MVRSILGTIAGVIVGFAIISVAEMGNAAIHPLPVGVHIDDRAAMAAYVAHLPLTALLIVVLGWAVASFAGGATAILIARAGKIPALIVAAVLLAGGVMNFMQIPHPLWMIVAGVVALTLPAWFAAMRLAPKAA